MGKHTQPYHQISFFNPAYCLQPLTTTKELPQRCSRDSLTFSSGRHHLHTSYDHDFNNNNPTSPKIGCMGQIKIKRDNKLSWPWMTPSTTRSSSTSNNGSRKFLKLGRVFSSRSLISPPRVSSSSEKVDDVYRVNTIISVTDMDPPLPVVKNVPKETNPASSSTLWKRRRGGEIHGLEGLQISSNSSMSVCATVSCAS
ncbi:hypothetical protein J5N97_009319 [Dioscorea zingiberensis]|uniref:Uncharacterized protein n=1 Tax=Dioscorea zingiberensis TaxID=325984 RepID=A0A9D5HLJ9_9LILI|nr:hypothetical protein J5N97_009319 [Dioscorea zingiberensis]